MEGKPNYQEKENNKEISADKTNSEILKNNINKHELYITEQNPELMENSFQKMSTKYIIKYQNEELNKFQDEILSFFKERDKYYTDLISKYKNRIEISEKNYENLANHLKLNYKEILSSQASLNNRLDKFNSYDAFVAKTNDNLTSHEIRINNLREDYTRTVQKYDKIYLDNLELPGYIGRCAKYKNCQLFFEDVIKEINKFNNYKEKNNIDLKTYKEKLEFSIKTFRNLLNNNNDAQIKYINKLNEKNLDESKNMVDNLSTRVMELRIENSKHSLELINKTNELKQEMEKIKEMKGELLNEFYNKIDDFKIETNKTVNSFNEFKNEYAIIRKKFLELAEFIKDIRFRKNLGGDVNKKDLNDLYKNLIKKNKKCMKDKNVQLLDDINKIEKMEFKINKIDNNDNINKEKNIRGNKKHETYNYTKNVFKGNIIEFNLHNNKNEIKKNDTDEINNDITGGNIRESKTDINNNLNNSEINKPSSHEKRVFLFKDSNSSRSSKNIFNNKMNLDNEKEDIMKNTYDNTEDLNKNNNLVMKNIKEYDQKSEKKFETFNLNKIQMNSNSKLIKKDKDKKCSTETDAISITDSCNSFNINNAISQIGVLSDKSISNISLPITYNLNNVKCNKFILNDIHQEENDNKIIKELAAELEQSTSKKNKKIINKYSKNVVENIEPINLNQKNETIEIINNSSDNIENKELDNKINNQIKKDEQVIKNNNNNNEKIFPLICKSIENENKDDNNNNKQSRKIISIIKDLKDTMDSNSPKGDNINNNTDKIYNLNSDIETNTETMNSKIGLFGQKLADIEMYMKNKFLELARQINEIKQQNSTKKKNLNRTVGYKSDKNIFNFLNNEICPNNYSINIKDDSQNIGNNRLIKLQKNDLYSHYFPSDIEVFKRNDYIKDSCTMDNWSKNRDKFNEDISVIKHFIEKRINIKTKNQDFYKKNIKGIFRDKNFNNNNVGIDAYEKIRNNSSSIKNDMKYVDLKVLINRKIPKNSCQKMNILLSGENKI